MKKRKKKKRKKIGTMRLGSGTDTPVFRFLFRLFYDRRDDSRRLETTSDRLSNRSAVHVFLPGDEIHATGSEQAWTRSDPRSSRRIICRHRSQEKLSKTVFSENWKHVRFAEPRHLHTLYHRETFSRSDFRRGVRDVRTNFYSFYRSFRRRRLACST